MFREHKHYSGNTIIIAVGNTRDALEDLFYSYVNARLGVIEEDRRLKQVDSIIHGWETMENKHGFQRVFDTWKIIDKEKAFSTVMTLDVK